jgi:hypothetical protein
MEEVVGSIPTRSTNSKARHFESPPSIRVLRQALTEFSPKNLEMHDWKLGKRSWELLAIWQASTRKKRPWKSPDE